MADFASFQGGQDPWSAPGSGDLPEARRTSIWCENDGVIGSPARAARIVNIGYEAGALPSKLERHWWDRMESNHRWAD